MDHLAITEAEIARSREDARFKQVLLARMLEQLLAALHRLQNNPAGAEELGARELREGALMAVQLADLIRSIDDRLSLAASA